ncbi:MAG: hypothetical protein IJI44_00440 [Erysipelotrichaceae bacterium]|nr:hypothetical protein [Erysipelotrichaceae bacterium]
MVCFFIDDLFRFIFYPAFQAVLFRLRVFRLQADNAGRLGDVLEAVRLAPSAVNKQPWRLVLRGDKVHFYEKSSKGYTSGDSWDIQKIDMGIALCHFELAAKECGFDISFEISDPHLAIEKDLHYIATYSYQE